MNQAGIGCTGLRNGGEGWCGLKRTVDWKGFVRVKCRETVGGVMSIQLVRGGLCMTVDCKD